MIEKTKILEFFKMMNASGCRYLLLKNIGNKLPDNLQEASDIDILVHPEDKNLFYGLMKKNRFLRNPYAAVNRLNGYVFLYPMEEGDWFIKDKLIIEVFYEVSVRALKTSSLLPLDRFLVNKIWENPRWDEKNSWYLPDTNIELVYLISRCVFDKKEFQQEYIKEIEKYKKFLYTEEVVEMLKLVFFKFTDTLIKMIDKGEYSQIVSAHLRFVDY